MIRHPCSACIHITSVDPCIRRHCSTRIHIVTISVNPMPSLIQHVAVIVKIIPLTINLFPCVHRIRRVVFLPPPACTVLLPACRLSGLHRNKRKKHRQCQSGYQCFFHISLHINPPFHSLDLKIISSFYYKWFPIKSNIPFDNRKGECFPTMVSALTLLLFSSYLKEEIRSNKCSDIENCTCRKCKLPCFF